MTNFFYRRIFFAGEYFFTDEYFCQTNILNQIGLDYGFGKGKMWGKKEEERKYGNKGRKGMWNMGKENVRRKGIRDEEDVAGRKDAVNVGLAKIENVGMTVILGGGGVL